MSSYSSSPPTPDGAPAQASDDAAVKRLVRTLTTTVFLQWIGATAIVPMLPIYVHKLGGNDALAGVVMASFFATGVLFQYPIGRISDRFGRRPVLIAGLVTYAVACFAFLLPIEAADAIALRGLQGLGAGAAAVASLAMVSASVPGPARGRAFASVFGGEVAGMAIGPLVGSVLGLRYLWLMFLAAGTISLIATIPAMRLTDAVADEEDAEPSTADEALAPLVWSRAMVGGLIIGSALGLGSGVYDICWTLLMQSRGASTLEIGISWTLFAAPFVLTTKPSGWLADHMDRRVLVLCGVTVAALFCVTYPLLPSVGWLLIAGPFEAIAFALALPASQSLLTEGAASDQVGRIQGLLATTNTACTALAAGLAGAAFAYARILPFAVAAGLVLTSVVVTAWIWRTVPGRVGADSHHDAITESPGFDPLGAGIGQAAGLSSEVQ